MSLKRTKAYKYCKQVVDGKRIAPRYVILQCEQALQIMDGENKDYIVDESLWDKYTQLLSLMCDADGNPLSDTLTGWQQFIILFPISTVCKKEKDKLRYSNVVLAIARKNGKSMIAGILLLLQMLSNPPYSRFYSVSPTSALSKEVKYAAEQIIACSPSLSGKIPKSKLDKFSANRDVIKCNINHSQYYPLAYNEGKMDGKSGNRYWICDEVGALPNPYAYEAMRSSQITMRNKMGVLISTMYPRANPFDDEIEHCKSTLDGTVTDEQTFALLYIPDDGKEWETDDNVILQANPLAQDIPMIFDEIKNKRARAIESPSLRENYLTKHNNIKYSGIGTDTYLDVEKLKLCAVDDVDFAGKTVYIGLDLSQSSDNTSVAITAYDDGDVYAVVDCFVPRDRMDEKSRLERLDYQAMAVQGYVIPVGDAIIDYGAIEDYILQVEDKYNCTVAGVAYDRWSALAVAQHLESQGIQTVECKQHSSILSPIFAWLFELVETGKFHYLRNPMLEINAQNARVTYDTNMQKYVNKKKSHGKIDAIFSLVDSLWLLRQETVLESNLNWSIQII